MIERDRTGGHYLGTASLAVALAIALCATVVRAQQPAAPPPAARTPATAPATREVNFSAVSANVQQPGSPVTIRILQWSTDEARDAFVAALTPPPPPPPGTDAAGRGGRGAAARTGGGAGPGGDGATARGGRGGAPVPTDPIAALAMAIRNAPAVGYFWTDAVTGYSIKYAYRIPSPDGGERIILATDRRIGAHAPAWTPVAPGASGTPGTPGTTTPATDYQFTLIEMHLDSKGVGEAKTSLTSKVVIDSGARTIALDNYAGAPAILKNVKR